MKLIVVGALVGFSYVGEAYAESKLRWGEFGFFSRWERYGYAIDSKYEFIGRLPELPEFPRLLKLALDPKMDRQDRAVIVSQMRTLSRCNFTDVLNGDSDKEAQYNAAIKQWEGWWEHYGADLAKDLPKKGRRYDSAWALLSRTPYLECPEHPILIPEKWSTAITFRSGDYGGVTEEIIEFRVTKEDCKLTRKYRTGWGGKGEWTYEIWNAFPRREADQFFAVLIYAIDNPWFFKDDVFSENAKAPGATSLGHIRGRPVAWSDYYPDVEWSGILDSAKQVIVNDDPWRWYTNDKSDPFLDFGGIGIVFRVVRDIFPDPSWNDEISRWQKQSKPATEGEQDADQPATKPADKPPVKNQPSTPTSKDGPGSRWQALGVRQKTS